jgi:predicted alpha-1,2-mannosidase
MKKTIFLSVCLFYAVGVQAQRNTVSQYVDPFIGTAAHGHTYPGAAAPFGMVQLSPDTDDAGWDWSSGYHYADKSIMGFSHTHLSGTGISDLADVLVMPYLGKVQLFPGKKDDPKTWGYRRAFRHENEKAAPAYYSVLLEPDSIRCELTATPQTGFHRYTFPKSDSANILIDLLHGLDRHRTWLTEKVLDSEIRILDKQTITGFRKSTGWANVQELYFQIRFSKPFRQYGTAVSEQMQSEIPYKRGKNVKAVFTFSTAEKEVIEMEVKISTQPFTNLQFSQTGFDEARKKTQQIWENALGKVQITGNENEKRIFYTALYHSLLAPNRLDNESFSALSLWDTYRAHFSLLTILQTAQAADIARFMAQRERLPVWHLWNNETDCMIGVPGVPIAAESVLKGLHTNFPNLGKTMQQDGSVAPWRLFDTYGYVPNDLDNFSVSKTLELCYANWCAAQIAKAQNRPAEYELYMKRSKYYKNLYDPKTGFFRGKDSKGVPTKDFDPAVTNEKDFVEATGWQYFFHVQHDIPGLIELVGGKEKFAQKLDQLFQFKNIQIDEHILDITGLIGQYAQGNEPCHHVAYLYNYVGQSWKTQERVRQILGTLYTDKPDGLCGNEDCGQMSAWYIFSSLGFYPVNPSSLEYQIGIPLFPKASLTLENGKTFEVVAKKLSDKNAYVQSVKLNGKILKKSYFTHQELMQGGVLEFEMGSRPNRQLFE